MRELRFRTGKDLPKFKCSGCHGMFDLPNGCIWAKFCEDCWGEEIVRIENEVYADIPESSEDRKRINTIFLHGTPRS